MAWNNQIKSHWMVFPYSFRFSMWKVSTNFECKIMCVRFVLPIQWPPIHRHNVRCPSEWMACASAPHPHTRDTYYYYVGTNKGDKWLRRRREKDMVFSSLYSFLASMVRWPWPTSPSVHHSNYHLFSFESTILDADTAWLQSLLVPPISVANNCFDVVCRKFYFYPVFWERASSPLSTSQCAPCARRTTRCGCRRTYKSELNFIQLSLPVERARHSSVQQWDSPRGPIHCYLFIWFSTLDFVFATLLAAVCRRCHCRRRRFNAKLEIVSYNFMGITAISFFFLFRPYIYVISSCLILLSSKWIPCSIRNANKKDQNMFCAKEKNGNNNLNPSYHCGCGKIELTSNTIGHLRL